MADPKGYYGALGLDPRTSHDEIVLAFHDLIDDLKDDEAAGQDTSERARLAREAFEVLGNPDRRAEYDAECFAREFAIRMAAANKPVRCQGCSRPTAQPRYLVFWSVVSNGRAALRRPTQGVFCAACARKFAWTATGATALLGWWSFKGLAWVPKYGVRNVVGGQHPAGVDDEILWRNALAFYAGGNHGLAAALARRVSRLEGPHRDDAQRFLETVLKEGGEPSKRLVNPWRFNPFEVAGRAAVLFLVPILLAGALSLGALGVSRLAAQVARSAATAQAGHASGPPLPAQGPCSVGTLSAAGRAAGNCQVPDTAINTDEGDATENLQAGAANYTPFAAPQGIQRPSDIE